jgi:hypothetical protein
MEVGVYIDGFNLYFGGRSVNGRGAPGWRWLDLRGLCSDLVARPPTWAGAAIKRIVYCTARVSGAISPSGQADQDVYLKGLLATKSVDLIEYGYYSATVKKSLLATENPTNKRPVVVKSSLPVLVLDSAATPVPGGQFMVSYLRLEEKGSDVNVATHLLKDVLTGDVDAAIVISNDSDLALPLRIARRQVPVGLIHPGVGRRAGALKASPSDGVGNHWWSQLLPADYTSHQLPDPAGTFTRPTGW